MNDFDGIESVQLEVSNDSKNFKLKKEIKIKEITSAFVKHESTLELLSGLFQTGKTICKENNYKSFRLKINTESEHFFLYDASVNAETKAEKVLPEVPAEEIKRYELLTNREKQILCFLSRGYKQDAIAYVFGMSVHTMKKHRYNIYEKTGFRNKTDLAVWCEKYLQSVFKQSA